MWLLLPAPAWALRPADAYLTPADSIQDAVDDASAGDVIELAGGDYDEDVWIGTRVTLRGESGATATLHSLGNGVVVDGVDGVRLTNLTLDGGSQEECLVVWSAQDLDLVDVRFDHCGELGQTFGGGAYVDDSEVELVDCAFTSNQAERASHVYAVGSTLSVTGSTFTDGVATDEGGIHVVDCDTTVNGGSFERNSGGGGGGALTFDGGTLRVYGARFERNEADQGGAIFSSFGARLEVTDATFVDNGADRGAAIDVSSVADTALLRTRFCRNTARYGATLRAYDGDASVVGTLFDESESGEAEAVQLLDGAFTFDQVTVTRSRGGDAAVEADDATVDLLRSLVVDNDAIGVLLDTVTFTADTVGWWGNVDDVAPAGTYTTGTAPYLADPELQPFLAGCGEDGPWPADGSGARDLGAFGGTEPLCALELGHLDADGDDYGDERLRFCPLEDELGTVPTGGDCDDQDDAVHPGAADAGGDGVDSDCDGSDPPPDPPTGDTGDSGGLDTKPPPTDGESSPGDTGAATDEVDDTGAGPPGDTGDPGDPVPAEDGVDALVEVLGDSGCGCGTAGGRGGAWVLALAAIGARRRRS